MADKRPVKRIASTRMEMSAYREGGTMITHSPPCFSTTSATESVVSRKIETERTGAGKETTLPTVGTLFIGSCLAPVPNMKENIMFYTDGKLQYPVRVETPNPL
ncbi:hypothetical protein, partial [Pseudorhizobium pelagicum]|uniref:hypothetical protein n=1 Tax=Pseudorhizobium pelagicum TaxID=1509405 RepID=UPI001AEC054F